MARVFATLHGSGHGCARPGRHPPTAAARGEFPLPAAALMVKETIMVGFEDGDDVTPAVVTAGGVVLDEFEADRLAVRNPDYPDGPYLRPVPLPPGGVRVKIQRDGTFDMTPLAPAPAAKRVPPPTERVEVTPVTDPWARRYGAADFPGPGDSDRRYAEFVVQTPGGLCVCLDEDGDGCGYGPALAYFPTDAAGTVGRAHAVAVWSLIGGPALAGTAGDAVCLLRRLAARPDVPADAADALTAVAAELHKGVQAQALPELRRPFAAGR